MTKKVNKINGFSDVLATQPAEVLSLCRYREDDLDTDRPSCNKHRNGGTKKKSKKTCSRTRFRTAQQAREALWSAFSGLNSQAGDALNGTHVGNLVISCDVCRGYHCVSPSEWLASQVAYAA